MKKHIDVKSVILGLVLAAAALFCIAAATGVPDARRWEYSIVSGKVIGAENSLGGAINTSVAQGWEFVSAAHSTEDYGFAVLRREKK